MKNSTKMIMYVTATMFFFIGIALHPVTAFATDDFTILPSNLRYVAGSTKIKNSNHPNGDTLDHDYLVTDGQKVGNYGPGANVRLMFTAEVVDDNLACGKNTLVNWAQAGVGDTTIQDEARVVVQNNKIFYVIAAIYTVTVTICLIIIIILARKVIKLNKAKNKARNKNSAEV